MAGKWHVVSSRMPRVVVIVVAVVVEENLFIVCVVVRRGKEIYESMSLLVNGE